MKIRPIKLSNKYKYKKYLKQLERGENEMKKFPQRFIL